MPAVRSFSELTKDFSSERRQRIEERKEQVRQDMTLAEPRKAFPLTQEHAGQEPPVFIHRLQANRNASNGLLL
jgi:hypothetical protein